MSKNGTKNSGDTVVTLSTGIKLKLTPVPDLLFTQAGRHLEIPQIPYVVDTRYDDGRKIANENDPQYIQDVEDYNYKLGTARIDAKILYGCEIVEGYPDNEKWLDKLLLQEKLGGMDLSMYDLSQDFHKEFIYIKLFAIGNELLEDGSNKDLSVILDGLDVSEQGVKEEAATFPGND